MDDAAGVAAGMSPHPRPRVTVESIVRDDGAGTGRVRVDGAETPALVRRLADDTYHVSIGDRRFEVVVARASDADWGCVDGRTYRWPREPRDDDAPPGTDDTLIAATTPATVTAVAVTTGQTVARGDTLVVVEAMKMEIPLRAPRDGRVTAVRCAVGDQVDPDVPLVELG